MKSSHLATFLALTTTALTQTPTTTIQIFDAGESAIPLAAAVASVIKADALSTVLALNCAANFTEAPCPLETPITYTQGPSTASASAVFTTEQYGVHREMTLIEGCDITSSTKGASCSMSMMSSVSVSGVSSSTSTSTETSFGEEEISYRGLAVTAGAEKLTAPEATQTPDGAAVAVTPAGNGGIGGFAAVVVAAAAMFF